MDHYRKVLNSEHRLPGSDVSKYIARQDPTHPEHHKVNYHSEYTGYKGVVWTPLDLPYVELDLEKLWNVWQDIVQEKSEGLAQPWFDKKPEDMNSSRHSTYNDHDYRALMCFKNGDYYGDVKGEWFDFMHEEFPQIVDFVEALPYDNIRWLAFVGRDDHGVGPHYDEYDGARKKLLAQEPSQLRIRWSNVTAWRREHLYFTKDHAQTRIYPMLPPDTNTMAYDGTVHEHGADAGYHPAERIQLMPMGTLNIKKWHELLDRSVEKYKDYIITTEHFKEV